MDKNFKDAINRRKFLKISALWTGGACIITIPGFTATPYRTLGRSEAEIMDALADAIIPPGEYAGGKDAWVTRFIDQQISSNGYLQHDHDLYKTCLPAMNNDSRGEFGTIFTELDENYQTEYLQAIEAGHYNSGAATRGWGNFTPSAFFNTMRNHCMMGYYGSPIHGGNRDYVSFRMISLF
ncbi:MAG: gluconate 2-dehydrogenase subunit 3 family protein [Balneolaceae bacterium]|nr:gluconate 2-dehydrogenase subunit 3 family protein [Balneolaceae bacterium]